MNLSSVKGFLPESEKKQKQHFHDSNPYFSRNIFFFQCDAKVLKLIMVIQMAIAKHFHAERDRFNRLRGRHTVLVMLVEK